MNRSVQYSIIMRNLTLAVCLFTVCAATQCGENEELVPCHHKCEPRCGYSPNICSMSCVTSQCECKMGYVRNRLKQCVRVADCSAETTECPDGEEFKSCGSTCEPTCQNPEPTACSEMCIMNTCQCAKGFVRYGYNCVTRDECPKRRQKVFYFM